KTLALFSRSSMPEREKLSESTVKHVAKAMAQLQGAIREIKRGVEVTSVDGGTIDIERHQPVHAIVLIPELDLLESDDAIGLDQVAKFMEKSGGFLHLLDVAELLRMVQAAEMISGSSKTVSPMMAFDYYLIERCAKIAEARTLRFSMLMRMG